MWRRRTQSTNFPTFPRSVRQQIQKIERKIGITIDIGTTTVPPLPLFFPRLSIVTPRQRTASSPSYPKEKLEEWDALDGLSCICVKRSHLYASLGVVVVDSKIVYMDGDGGLGVREWGYYQQPFKSNIGLQLMPDVGAERDTKNLLSNGAFLHRDCGIPQPSIPMEFARDGWMHHREKFAQMLPMNYPSYAILPDATGSHPLQMSQLSDPSKNGKLPQIDEPGNKKDAPLKKRPQGRTRKAPIPKKPKKIPSQRDAPSNGSVPRGRAGRKNTSIVINGIDLDLSGMPTPVCSCTGIPQQCYRWGMGGWQSACCTTSVSEYPLPMSTKRRGARIPGRKMSLGAFKKVLEKLAGEGYNLSNPIDLRFYWAKHGTNKFVTIR